MANELAIRFTEDLYATKSEVIKELRMSLIDNIWSNILSYRSEFSKYFSIRSVERNQYSFCHCHNVENLLANTFKKEESFIKEYSNNADANDYKLFKNNNLLKILRGISQIYDIEAPDGLLNALVNEQSVQVNGKTYVLANYLKTLSYCASYNGPVDEGFIIDLCKRLSNGRIFSYRTADNSSINHQALIDRVYLSAPVKSIESMMNTLAAFIDNSTEDKYVIAASVLYYINYVKPFEEYNKELAMLLFKCILAREFGNAVFYMDFEQMYLSNQFEKTLLDSQKSCDLTYFAIFVINNIQRIYDASLDNIIAIKSNALKADFYRLDEPKVQTKEEPPVNNEQIKLEFEEEKKPVEEKKEKLVKKEKVEPIRQQEIPSYNAAAFNLDETRLEEKQLRKMATHLMELDPLLSKKEAKFYAGHCTIGKMYSIAQFKKEIGCVYETARTSMDHLAALGYYKKEQVKNKFFYTPISKR